MALIKRNTAYSVNDIVNTKYGTKLKCTTAGTTSTDPLILDGTSPITDGTVVWEVQEEQGGGGGQGSESYSTTEQEIGTWVDGKPLYQKTLVKTGGVASGTVYFNNELPNIDYLQKVSASFRTDRNRYESEYFYTGGDALQILAFVNSSNVGSIYTIFSRTVSEMYVTVQYTKTTD